MNEWPDYDVYFGVFPVIEVRLPLRTVNALNERAHWSKRARRAKQERVEAAWSLLPWKRKGELKVPCTVTLTRESKKFMDGDGLQASFKNLRDGVADALGVDDADPRVTWCYAQQKAKEYGVVIQVRPAG